MLVCFSLINKLHFSETINLKRTRTTSRVHMNVGWQLHGVWVLSHFESLHQSPSAFRSTPSLH